MVETKKRSWVKSITWRIMGVAILGFIAWLCTGDWTKMTIITATFHAIRFVLYYFHERWWNKIKWGITNEN